MMLWLCLRFWGAVTKPWPPRQPKEGKAPRSFLSPCPALGRYPPALPSGAVWETPHLSPSPPRGSSQHWQPGRARSLAPQTLG